METGRKSRCPHGHFPGDRTELEVSSGWCLWRQDRSPGVLRAVSLVPACHTVGPAIWRPGSLGVLSAQPASSRSYHSSRDLLAPMAQSPVSSSRSGLSGVSVSAPGCRPGSRLSLAADRSAAMAAGGRRPAGAPVLGLGSCSQHCPPGELVPSFSLIFSGNEWACTSCNCLEYVSGNLPVSLWIPTR